MKFLFAVAFFALTYKITFASRILFLFPTPSKSHVIVAHGLSTALAEKGHDVTVVSPFPLSKPVKNHREVKVILNADYEKFLKDLVKESKEPRYKMLFKFGEMVDLIKGIANDTLEMPEFKKIMNEEKFDLVVIGFFFHNFLVGVGDHFKCPTIILSVNVAMMSTNVLVGNPLSISSVPGMLGGSERMNFLGRTKNFLLTGIDFVTEAYMYYWQKKFYE